MSRRGLDIAFTAAFAVLLVANLVPLTAEYLPFSDLHGHMGVVAALIHWTDPASNTQQLFALNPDAILHSMLFEYLGALVCRVIPVTVYTNLFIAIFYVAALPLSLVLLLKAYGRSPRLALIIFPFIYVRLVWFGFVDYLASVPLVLVSLALVRRSLDEGVEARMRTTALLLVSANALVVAHFFGALVFYGLCALVLLLEWPRPLVLVRIVVSFVPGLLFLLRWRAGRRFADVGALVDTLRGNRSIPDLLKHFHEWTLGGIPTPLADVVLTGLGISLVAAAVWGIRNRSEPARSWRYRSQPLVLFVVTTVMFFVLPHRVPGWWAVNVRLVPLVVAFAIVAIPETARPPRLLVLAPAMCAGLFWGLYLGWDFHHWFNGVETAGFDRTVDAIPRGRTVLALWPNFESERHYKGFPMAYLGTLYVARRGGMVTPMINGPDCDEPIRPRALPAAPVWGYASRFDYRTLSHGWQYFLVKRPPPGNPPLAEPFKNAPQGAVRLVAKNGLWEAWENRMP